MGGRLLKQAAHFTTFITAITKKKTPKERKKARCLSEDLYLLTHEAQ